MHITKEKWTHRYKEQTSGYQWEKKGVRGKKGVGDEGIQTIRYKNITT